MSQKLIFLFFPISFLLYFVSLSLCSSPSNSITSPINILKKDGPHPYAAQSAIGEKKEQDMTEYMDIYILAGQSNMAGRGKITDSFRLQGNDLLLSLDVSGSWVRAAHPLHFDKPRVAGVGPGLRFGLDLLAHYSSTSTLKNRQIGLVPCAVGGTPISAWQPGAYDSSSRTHPYDDAVARIQTAMQSGKVRGIIWMQGEGDTRADRMEVYLEKLEVLIKRFRTIVGDSTLPFVAGELGPYRPRYQSFNKMLAGLPEKVPFTGVVSSTGLMHLGDTTHLDAVSADTYGKRFAEEMIRLMKYKTQ